MKLLIVRLSALFLFNIKEIVAVDISGYQDFHNVEQTKKPVIPILKHSFEQHDEGYRYSYETGNGIHAQESGYIKNKGNKKHEILVQQGSITYHDEHGNPITLNYIADEHGFQPQGSHLPTPPPISDEIQKVIDSQNHAEQQHIVYEQQISYEQKRNYEHAEH